MLKEFKYKGYWFLPEQPENRIPGILTFEPNKGAVLELIGAMVNNRTFEIINGDCENGKYITLCDCRNDVFSFAMNGFDTQNLKASYTFISNERHYNKESLRFNCPELMFTAINEWTRTYTGFTKIDYQLEQKTNTIEYQIQNPIKISVNDEFYIQFEIIANMPIMFHPMSNKRDSRVIEQIETSFNYREDKPFEDIIEDINHFGFLITIFTQRTCEVTSFSFKVQTQSTHPDAFAYDKVEFYVQNKTTPIEDVLAP